MGNVGNAGFFLLDTRVTLYLAVLILRIGLRWVSADFYNPLSQFIWQVTNPPVQPLTRLVPRWRKLDTAALVLLVLLSIAAVWLLMAVAGYRIGPLTAVVYGLLKLVLLTLNVLTFTIFVQAILSWVGPGGNNPAASLLWQFNEPILGPARRIMPPIGGLDLSPLVVILVLQFAVRLLWPGGPIGLAV